MVCKVCKVCKILHQLLSISTRFGGMVEFFHEKLYFPKIIIAKKIYIDRKRQITPRTHELRSNPY